MPVQSTHEVRTAVVHRSVPSSNKLLVPAGAGSSGSAGPQVRFSCLGWQIQFFRICQEQKLTELDGDHVVLPKTRLGPAQPADVINHLVDGGWGCCQGEGCCRGDRALSQRFLRHATVALRGGVSWGRAPKHLVWIDAVEDLL